MNQLKLVSPDRMLDVDNRLHITNDVNHAMVEFGFIVKGNFLKWLILGSEGTEKGINRLFIEICAALARHGKMPDDLRLQLNKNIEKYLYDLPIRRRLALAFILFNSEDFRRSIAEINEHLDLSPGELKTLLGKHIEREIYVGGSYDLEIKIRDYLASEIVKFASEFSFISGCIKRERVMELLDIYSRSSLAMLGFDE
jgi:hypothetical protein